MQGLTDSTQHTTLSLLLVRVQKRGPLVSVRPGAPEMVVMVTCGVIYCIVSDTLHKGQ